MLYVMARRVVICMTLIKPLLILQKISTMAKIECRGNFSYEVRIFPLRIGFSPRKSVFEPIVVEIFLLSIKL